ncbi:MAG: D-alanine--D-alanine ligase [Oscillospiraceae bacterium]|nr:D-alanine--D-alanine ligase [Oscillospiraceae bacterium]
MKIKLCVMFGGKSVEHEVSVISALQAIASIDQNKYEIIPVYITKENEFYTSFECSCIEEYKNIPALLKKSERCVLMNMDGKVKLLRYPLKKVGNNVISEIDVAFPIVHGTNVEDGTLQGYLKTLGLPFVGCDVTASAVGMDKYVMKTVLKDNDVPVLDCVRFFISDFAEPQSVISRCEKRIGYPVIVKPVNLGSSVGISVAHNAEELNISLEEAFKYASVVLCERAITKLKEVNCSVLGDTTAAFASECESPAKSDEILSYKDKYTSGGGGKKGGKTGGSKGMASLARKIPADIPPERREEIRDMAVKAFKVLGCNGVSRIDFMIDEETDTVYLNEINTIPGSLSFYLWEPIGVPYTKLLDRMIELALKRKREEDSIVFSFETNILNIDRSFGGSKGSKGGKL